MLNTDGQNRTMELVLDNKYQPDFFIKCLTSMLYDRGERPQRPLFVSWDLVNYCNLNCFFCSANASKRVNIKNEEIKNFRIILNKLIEAKPLYVSLLGGEPTLHPYWQDIVESLNMAGIYVEIITNGVGIDKKAAQKLASLNQDLLRVKISLDSLNAAHNDEQRGKDSYFLATRALNYLSIYPIKNLRVQMVITSKNVDDIFTTYQFLHNYAVSSFGSTNILPTGRAHDYKVNFDQSKVVEEYSKCLSHYNKEKKIRIEKVGFGYKQHIQHLECLSELDVDSERMFKIKCYSGFGRMNIDQNGDIYPCDYLKYEEFKAGNLFRESFSSIWNSDVFSKLINMRRSDKNGCATCLIKNCNTGCMGLAYERYGTIKMHDPNCERMKG